MNQDLVEKVAAVGAPDAPKGIVLQFNGLGSAQMKDAFSPQEQRWMDAGAVCVTPYYGLILFHISWA